MLKAELLSHTPNPELMIAAAARLCYSGADINEIFEALTPEKTAGFLLKLTELGHESPIEHVSFTFGIEGVSRSLLAQLTRHRIASYSVKSQRYVNEGVFEFVTPPEIDSLPEARELFLKEMKHDTDTYNKLVRLLFDKHLAALTADGTPEKPARAAAEKMAIEDARYVLPNACETKMIVTMNARSLNNFFRLRCCHRAQWEIRRLATKMLELAKEAAPTLFALSGPGCVSGPCPEAAMSCGRGAETREKFRQGAFHE